MQSASLSTISILVIASVASGAGLGARPPNVVILLADDAGWGDHSLTGNENIQTPHIDSIGRHGAVLEHFYVAPMCSATRAELLTGRYHPRTGVWGTSLGRERLNLDERTIAQMFRKAGYATGVFGKWHNGSQWPYHPNARGFDEFYGFTSGHWGEYFNAPLEHNGRQVRGNGYIADDFTDRALEFIRKCRDRPFFCYVPFNTPHRPFSVPDGYWDRFKDHPVRQRGALGGREELPVTRCTLAMMQNIDDNVGRILRLLDELDLTRDTIVLYFSDNGPHSVRWNGGMRGKKGDTDEGGVRSVFVMKWPGRIEPGRSVSRIAGAIDLLPTLTSLAGIGLVPDRLIDGRDLSPLLLGRVEEWPDRMIFSASPKGEFSARSQRYRFDAAGALFDMVKDPGQTEDIAAREPGLAARFAAAVAIWSDGVMGLAAPVADDRPHPVGYAEFPLTVLPARDGSPAGRIRRSASASNCSYFLDWRSTDDTITWDIEVHHAGLYSVSVSYTCPEADIGSTVRLEFKGAVTTGKVTRAWDPPLILGEDRVPRKSESLMKEFAEMQLGQIRLEVGRGPLVLRAADIAGATVMDLRDIRLTLTAAL